MRPEYINSDIYLECGCDETANNSELGLVNIFGIKRPTLKNLQNPVKYIV
jgi:hypothetical protein